LSRNELFPLFDDFNMKLQRTIKAVIRAGEQSGYVAECLELPVVTQGETLDEVTHNLHEAIQLHLEGEDLAELGLAPNPTVLVTFELEPVIVCVFRESVALKPAEASFRQGWKEALAGEARPISELWKGIDVK
jgi:predicted RNase H-like HicB family nuclease